jgi:hypothetical protein
MGAIASLRHRVDSMRVELDDLRVLVVTRGTTVRLGPPPLPPEASEVTLVDERDVTLESIRPRGSR